MSAAEHQRASSLPVRVITAHSGLDAFRTAIASLTANSGQATSLAWRFFLRDTRADHRQSLLGYFWLVVPALVNALIWIFLNNQKVIRIDSGNVPYPVFVMSGTILWTAFNSSLMAMLGVVNGARSFLGKVNFPHESLVYSAFFKALVDTFIASLILVPTFLIFHARLPASAGLFPLALIASLLLGSALGLVALPVAALYSDIARAVQLVLRFGLFLTPVIFPLPLSGFARKLMLLNPATPIVVTGRAWLTGSAEAMPTGFFLIVIASLLLLVASLVFFKVTLPHLIERLSS